MENPSDFWGVTLNFKAYEPKVNPTKVLIENLSTENLNGLYNKLVGNYIPAKSSLFLGALHCSKERKLFKNYQLNNI